MNAPRILTARGHHHAEAFCLMTYACEGKHLPGPYVPGTGRMPRSAGCGHREIYWNSRDGVTPFGKMCPSCGGDLLHTNFKGDVYSPQHKPHRGQGIWRDGTPDEAERFTRETFARAAEQGDSFTAEQIEKHVADARSGDPERAHSFQKGWPMFERFDPRGEG